MPGYAILQAPTNLGLWPSGVERLGDALIGAGLTARLRARRAARVEPPPYDSRRDPATGMLNPGAIAAYSVELADAVGGVLDRGEVPVVLGGDCSVMLGSMLALRRRGRHGLLFLDGHLDFASPEAERAGEAASMELALATGDGPRAVADLEGLAPLVRREDTAALGMRDGLQPLDHEQRVTHAEPLGLLRIDLAAVRREGAAAVAARALAHLLREGGPGGFWVHLDADVVDDALMPAVDGRMPDGLTWDELAAVLRAAVASGRAVGFEVTIFNPDLDRDGAIARDFVEALARGLTG